MIIARLLFLPILLLLGGCVSLRAGPVPSVVHSTWAPSDAEVPAVAFDLQLGVAEPQVLSLWQSNRVLLRTVDGELGVLQGVVLADETAQVVQASLIEAMQSRSGLRGVGRPGDGSRNEWLLLSELPRFELDYRASPGRAVVELDLRVLDVSSGRVLASTRLNAEQALPDSEALGSPERSRAHARTLLDLLQQQASRAADWLHGLAKRRNHAAPQDGFEG